MALTPEQIKKLATISNVILVESANSLDIPLNKKWCFLYQYNPSENLEQFIELLGNLNNKMKTAISYFILDNLEYMRLPNCVDRWLFVSSEEYRFKICLAILETLGDV